MKAIKYKIQTRKKWFQWFLTITYPLYRIKWQSISKIKHSIDTENDCMIASDTINCVCVCMLLMVLLFTCSVTSNSLVTPWAVAHQASLSMGFPRQESWRGLPFPSPADLSDHGLNLCLLHWQANSLLGSHQESPVCLCYHMGYYMVLNDAVILVNFTEKIKTQILSN